MDTIQGPESGDRPRLRSHKALRRWDLTGNAGHPSRSTEPSDGTTVSVGNGSVYSPTRVLPLTPPASSLEDQKSPPIPQDRSHDAAQADLQGNLTPTNKTTNPPTPDITPPRAITGPKNCDSNLRVPKPRRPLFEPDDHHVDRKIWDGQDAALSASVEDFATNIGWPKENEQDDLDPFQTRRISTASTTTIEAFVIDSPPQKPRTLRRTGKNGSLRSFSTPAPSPSSMSKSAQVQPQAQPRLAHKRARITNEDRLSIASDISIQTASLDLTPTKPRPVEDVIRVVVVPQRRSSLKSSMPARPVLRSILPSHHRPATAPDSGLGGSLRSSLRHKRRTASESLPSASSSSGAFKPRVPVRRSSLSAPTSRNTSRAGSISEECKQAPMSRNNSLAMKEFLNTKPLPKLPLEAVKRPPMGAQQPSDPLVTELIPKPLRLSSTSITTPQIILTSGDDNDYNKIFSPPTPPAAPFTPLQLSIESLSFSPGPVEISQATAVPVFAHNNRSLLVVEHPLSEARPYTADVNPPTIPAEYVESPLRHPRAAPKPPGFLMPTVTAAPLARANTLPSRPRPPLPVRTDSSGTGNGLVRRLSSVRRRFSVHRTSTGDSIPSTTAAKDISTTTHRVRNRMAGKNLDSKQHPFWRPHGFWEDYDDEGTTGGDDGNARTNRLLPKTTTTITAGNELPARGYESGQYVSNTLGIPQASKLFQGPIALIRRVSRRSRSHPRAIRAPKPSSTASLPIFFSDSRRDKRAHPLRPLHSLQEWISRTRQRRAQEKLEARREKLRRAIGGNIVVDYLSVASTMDPESVFSSSRI